MLPRQDLDAEPNGVLPGQQCAALMRSQAEGKASAWVFGTGSSPHHRRRSRKGSKQLRAPWGEPSNRRAHTHCELCDLDAQSGTTLSSKETCFPITLLSQCPSLIHFFFFQSANSVITCVVYTEFRPIPCSQSSDTRQRAESHAGSQ